MLFFFFEKNNLMSYFYLKRVQKNIEQNKKANFFRMEDSRVRQNSSFTFIKKVCASMKNWMNFMDGYARARRLSSSMKLFMSFGKSLPSPARPSFLCLKETYPAAKSKACFSSLVISSPSVPSSMAPTSSRHLLSISDSGL